MSETRNHTQQGRDDAAEGMPKNGADRIFDDMLTAKLNPSDSEVSAYNAGYDEVANA